MQHDSLASSILAVIRGLGPNTANGFAVGDLLPSLPGVSEVDLVEELKAMEMHGQVFRIANNRYTLPTPQTANPAASLVSDSSVAVAPANGRARRFAIIGGVALVIVMLLVLGPFRG